MSNNSSQNKKQKAEAEDLPDLHARVAAEDERLKEESKEVPRTYDTESAAWNAGYVSAVAAKNAVSSAEIERLSRDLTREQEYAQKLVAELEQLKSSSALNVEEIVPEADNVEAPEDLK